MKYGIAFRGLLGAFFGISACTTDDGADREPDGGECAGAKCDDLDASDPLSAEELAALTVCVEHPGEREVRQSVQALLDGLRAGDRGDVTSIADFVAALPASTRGNLMFLTHSRALARVHTADEQRRLLLDTRPSDERTIDNDREDNKWCVSQPGDHTACVESRVLMMSPDGDFVGSFTTNPESPSEGHFELTLFDPATSDVTLFDVDFTGAKPQVEQNPSRCMACHQGGNGDINFRFDPYRFWSFATPFNEDFLRAGSVEAEWYLSLLERIEGGKEPALAALNPNNTLATVRGAMESGMSMQLRSPDADVDFAGVDSPGLGLSHQLLEKNGCRTAKALTERPDYDKIKYAAIGALINCENVEDFWPTEGSLTRADAEDYFARRREGQTADGFDLDTLQAQTHAMQTRLLSDKLSRRFDHVRGFVGSERAWREIEDAIGQTAYGSFSGYGVSNFETYGPHITKARYLLEPLGVDVAQWSMAVDRENHSHVEFLYPIAMQPVFLDTLKREFDLEGVTGRAFDVHGCKDMTTRGASSPQSASGSCRRAIDNARPKLCPELAEASRNALTDHEVRVDSLFAAGPREIVPEVWDYTVDDTDELEAEAVALAESTDAAVLRDQAAGIYRENCRGCHVRGYARGRPLLPFDEITDMESMFADHHTLLEDELHGDQMGRSTEAGKYVFEYISNADRIWDRLTRHPMQHGAMPFDGESLPRTDKVKLRAHMISVGAVGH